MKTSGIKYNEAIKRNQYTGEYVETGRHWLFDNGQWAEKTPIKERDIISLAYHYGRVYVNVSRQADTGGGRFGVSQLPYKVCPERFKVVVSALFQADKECEIIPESYELN